MSATTVSPFRLYLFGVSCLVFGFCLFVCVFDVFRFCFVFVFFSCTISFCFRIVFVLSFYRFCVRFFVFSFWCLDARLAVALAPQAASVFTTAIVTGRSKDKVYNFVGLDDVFYAGSHGLEIQGPLDRPVKCQVSEKASFRVEILRGLGIRSPGASTKHAGRKMPLSMQKPCGDWRPSYNDENNVSEKYLSSCKNPSAIGDPARYNDQTQYIRESRYHQPYTVGWWYSVRVEEIALVDVLAARHGSEASSSRSCAAREVIITFAQPLFCTL